jgi:putative membrane protein
MPSKQQCACHRRDLIVAIGHGACYWSAMPIAAKIAVALVAAEHVYIMVLEMFLWTKPYGRRAFGMSQEDADRTAVLAKNQGLYNGFLAAGLFWSLAAPELYALPIARFFTGCVLVAGLYGGATAKRSIVFVQGIPAAVALGLTFL